MNYPDAEMTEVEIPEDFLSHFYLGCCTADRDPNYACSSPGSEYSDFNVWDRSLSTDQLVRWTTCK